MDPITLDLIKIGGPALGVVGIIVVIIKLFLSSQSKQEAGYQAMIEKMNERNAIMIGNHLNHNTQAMEKLNETLSKNTVMVEKVLTYLQVNGRK